MKNKRFLTLLGMANRTVQVRFIPTLQHIRLALGKIAAHRKAGFWQVQRVLIVSHSILCSIISTNRLSPHRLPKKPTGGSDIVFNLLL